jgi:hypothetical protein
MFRGTLEVLGTLFLSPEYEILGEIACFSMDRQESNEMVIQHWSCKGVFLLHTTANVVPTRSLRWSMSAVAEFPADKPGPI